VHQTAVHPHDREQVADLFHALGNPARLRLLELLADRPRSGTALAVALGITTTRLNRQLFVLRQSGLLTCADRSGLREWAEHDPAVMQVVTQLRAMVHTMSPS
jgi:DNA-binding transcriptional ArsR family regulator